MLIQIILQRRCVRIYPLVSVCIDCASAKVLIPHILPQFTHRFVFISIAINPFSRFPIRPFHAPNCSKSRHFVSKFVVLLAIDSPLEKSCFSVRFAHTYSLNSLPPPSLRTPQIQALPQSCAAACPFRDSAKSDLSTVLGFATSIWSLLVQACCTLQSSRTSSGLPCLICLYALTEA